MKRGSITVCRVCLEMQNRGEDKHKGVVFAQYSSAALFKTCGLVPLWKEQPGEEQSTQQPQHKQPVTHLCG